MVDQLIELLHLLEQQVFPFKFLKVQVDVRHEQNGRHIVERLGPLLLEVFPVIDKHILIVLVHEAHEVQRLGAVEIVLGIHLTVD